MILFATSKSPLKMKQRSYLRRYFLLISLVFYASCKGDISHKADKNETPDRVFTQAHIIHKDSGELKMDLKAPVIEQYQFEQGKNQKLFPSGIHVIFYEKNKITPGHLKAHWAEELESEGLYKAKGQVEIINAQGDTLRTDEIFWNRGEKKIYTNALTQIHRADGTELTAKNGLESSEDLNDLILKNTEGTIPLKENDSL